MWKEAFSALALDGLERRDRTGLINAISGIRTAFLAISGKDGNWNAGVFTNVTHVGANPASMSILFRPDNGNRHTYTNYKTFKRITLVALPEKEMQRLPELKGLPLPHLHEPWAIPPMMWEMEQWNIGAYPKHPIVDLSSARKHASDQLYGIKKTKASKLEAQLILEKLVNPRAKKS